MFLGVVSGTTPSKGNLQNLVELKYQTNVDASIPSYPDIQLQGVYTLDALLYILQDLIKTFPAILFIIANGKKTHFFVHQWGTVKLWYINDILHLQLSTYVINTSQNSIR